MQYCTAQAGLRWGAVRVLRCWLLPLPATTQKHTPCAQVYNPGIGVGPIRTRELAACMHTELLKTCFAAAAPSMHHPRLQTHAKSTARNPAALLAHHLHPHTGHLEPARWIATGYHPTDVAYFLAATNATLSHPHLIPELRIKSSTAYRWAVVAWSAVMDMACMACMACMTRPHAHMCRRAMDEEVVAMTVAGQSVVATHANLVSRMDAIFEADVAATNFTNVHRGYWWDLYVGVSVVAQAAVGGFGLWWRLKCCGSRVRWRVRPLAGLVCAP